MNTFQENAENSWPEDEAILEASFYLAWVKQLDCRIPAVSKIAYNDLKTTLQEYSDIFENDSFLLRFITEFNKHVPDFCKIPEEMQKEFCKQDDLFS